MWLIWTDCNETTYCVLQDNHCLMKNERIMRFNGAYTTSTELRKFAEASYHVDVDLTSQHALQVYWNSPPLFSPSISHFLHFSVLFCHSGLQEHSPPAQRFSFLSLSVLISITQFIRPSVLDSLKICCIICTCCLQ